MKKRIIIGIIVVALLVAGGLWLNYYLSFKNVTIKPAKQDMSLGVYVDDHAPEDGSEETHDKLMTVTGDQTIRLQAGSYMLLPDDKTYSQSPITFTVSDSDTTVDANPAFSDEYLTSQLKNETAEIQTLLTTTYPQLTTYTINPGRLYLDGSWYGTTMIQPSVGPGVNGEVYRTVLHKVNGKWQVAALPRLVQTKSDNKDVPESILRDLNQQAGF